MDRNQRAQGLSAHGASLPLYAALQKMEARPIDELLQCVDETLGRLHLQPDIQPVILFQKSTACLDLESTTSYGKEIIEELKTRSEFLPCPPGECDYDPSDVCRWCGKVK